MQNGHQNRPKAFDAKLQIFFLCRNVNKARFFLFFHSVGLDYANTRKDIVQDRTALRIDVPTLAEHGMHKAPEKAEAKGYQRHRDQNKRRHKGVIGEHQHRNAEEQKHLFDYIGHVIDQKAFDLLRITVDVLHQVARRTCRNFGNGKLLNLAEHRIAQANN